MGEYTELIFGAAIKKDIPQNVLNVLNYLFNGEPRPIYDDELPDHEFFRCGRWTHITRGSSYYFAVRNTHASMVHDKISNTYNCSSRGNLKNYENEIEKFLAWIKPYIEQGSGEREFYAIVCTEQQLVPTIYCLKDEET